MKISYLARNHNRLRHALIRTAYPSSQKEGGIKDGLPHTTKLSNQAHGPFSESVSTQQQQQQQQRAASRTKPLVFHFSYFHFVTSCSPFVAVFRIPRIPLPAQNRNRFGFSQAVLNPIMFWFGEQPVVLDPIIIGSFANTLLINTRIDVSTTVNSVRRTCILQ